MHSKCVGSYLPTAFVLHICQASGQIIGGGMAYIRMPLFTLSIAPSNTTLPTTMQDLVCFTYY